MDELKFEIKALNSNLERIAKSLERTEALNARMLPFIEAYMKLLDACGVQDPETINKIAFMAKVGIDKAYEETKELAEEDDEDEFDYDDYKED